MWAKVLSAALKAGKAVYNWAKANKTTIMKWINRGWTIATIIDTIKSLLGL